MAIIHKLKRPPSKADDAKDPEAWRRSGDRLLKSARLIAPFLTACHDGFAGPERSEERTLELIQEADYMFGFLLLLGLALENHLKARVVERLTERGELPETAAQILKAIKGHNLVSLAERSGAPLAEYKGFLADLTEWTVWASRYPVPLCEDDLSFKRILRSDHLGRLSAS